MKTIEEKATRYDEALERAKDFINGEVHYPLNEGENIMCWIFPELRESEDEKIRKALISILKSDFEKDTTIFGISVEQIIAWLKKQESLTTDEEKQGKEDVLWCIKQAKKYAKDENEMGTCWFAEQWLEKQGNKPQGKKALEAAREEKVDNANKIEQKHTPKHRVGDTIYYNSFGELKSMIVANVVTDSTDNPMYEDKEGNAVFEKDLIEQNPAWSEEDEQNLIDACVAIRKFYHGINGAQELIDWLQSLKERMKGMNE